MLSLYDHTIWSRNANPAVGVAPLSDEREPSGLARTTAAQLLFLVEGSEMTDTRLPASVCERTIRGR